MSTTFNRQLGTWSVDSYKTQVWLIHIWRTTLPGIKLAVKLDTLCVNLNVVQSYFLMKWYNFNWNPCPSRTPLVVISVIAIAMDWVVFMLPCSLQHNGLTDNGVTALARALQHSRSLEELKYVVNWVTHFIMQFLVAIRSVRIEHYLRTCILILGTDR